MTLPPLPRPDGSVDPSAAGPAAGPVAGPVAGPPPSTVGSGAPMGYPYAAGPASGRAPSWPGAEAEALRKAKTALGWAVGAAVAAGLALIGVIALLVLNLVQAEQNVQGPPIVGTVTDFHVGSDLDGARLAIAVTNALSDVGSSVDGIHCSSVPAAQVASPAVCTGSFDGVEDWQIVVHVLDEDGAILVNVY